MTTRRLVEPTEFSRYADGRTSGPIADGRGAELIVARDVMAVATIDETAAGSRRVSYTLSDESIARDGHTVATAGFQLGNYRANPVVMWAHDTSQPPIGRMSKIDIRGSRLIGTVEYADAGLSPFADMIFRMVKRGFLNAVSISWMPLEWRFAKSKDRVGGIDFLRQDLLEVSQVPVPALATALAAARAAGVDVAPMRSWAEGVLDGENSVVMPRAEAERLWAVARGHVVSDADADRQTRIRRAKAIALAGGGL